VSSGSWGASVPSPYGSGMPASTDFWQNRSQGARSNLPSETEVQETYASFGIELQQCLPALAAVIDQQIIDQVIRGVEDSDRLWQQALAQRGWRLSTDLPRVSYPSMGLGMGVGASGSQELSVFDRNLPKPFCDDPQANQAWAQRQNLETFFVHPQFGPSSRPYVLDRLREWRQRGIANGMRHDWRPSEQMPTDGHILENLVFKMLQMHLDFADCFLSAGHAPPAAKHMGQAPTAYLRQITDQAVSPRPPPHYEVVTLQKTWRLRPGNNNLLEALAVLMHALRRHSRSYQSFPQVLRSAVEAPQTGSAMSGLRSLYNSLF